MRGRMMRGGAAMLLLGSLLLSGCTEQVREKCSGTMDGGDRSCTFTYKRSDGQWSTRLEAAADTDAVLVSGTVTLESGTGTLLIEGSDVSYEYPLAADTPLVLEDLRLETRAQRSERSIYLEVDADPQIEGFSAELEYVAD